MSKTKIAGYLLLTAAVINVGIDVFDGNGFSLASHFDELVTALGAAGLVFLRDSVRKVQESITKQ